MVNSINLVGKGPAEIQDIKTELIMALNKEMSDDEIVGGSEEAHALLGEAIACLMTNDYEESVVLLRKAIKLNPESSHINSQLADSLMGLGKSDEAQEYLEKTIRLIEGELDSSVVIEAVKRAEQERHVGASQERNKDTMPYNM